MLVHLKIWMKWTTLENFLNCLRNGKLEQTYIHELSKIPSPFQTFTDGFYQKFEEQLILTQPTLLQEKDFGGDTKILIPKLSKNGMKNNKPMSPIYTDVQVLYTVSANIIKWGF